MNQNVTYRFGAFRLETNSQLLCNENERIRLQPKVYCLLVYFLQHSGRLISKDELLDEVWHDRIVEDTALRLAVNSLRKALQDNSKAPRYLLTACRRGYRFLPEVTVDAGFKGRTGLAASAGLQYHAKAQFFDIAGPYRDELTQLVEAFEQAADGNRRLVFLKGERGIGKTVLLERFLALIKLSNKALLHAHCVQLSRAFEPYLPLLAALEKRCLKPDGKPLIEGLRKIAPTWLYQMSSMLESGDFTAFYPKDPQISTGRMLREGAHFFEQLGSESTFVLILDNSHWSDEFTLDLVNFLASRCLPTRLLMILSFRPYDKSPRIRQLEEMREELRHRGVCRELTLGLQE